MIWVHRIVWPFFAALLAVTVDARAQGFGGEAASTSAWLPRSGARCMRDAATLCYGDDSDYWFVYNSTSTQFELWSTNGDGAGTNTLLLSVDDGTDDIRLENAGALLYGDDTDGPAIENAAASDLNPTLIPRRSSMTSGVGSSAANRVDFITNGADMGFFTTTAFFFTATSATVNVRGNLADDTGNLSVADNVETAGILASTGTSLSIDSATTIAITRNFHILDCVGAETLTTITGGISGQYLTIKFLDADVCTLTNDDTGAANTLDLSAAFTSTARDTITFVFDGTSWVEVARAVN